MPRKSNKVESTAPEFCHLLFDGETKEKKKKKADNTTLMFGHKQINMFTLKINNAQWAMCFFDRSKRSSKELERIQNCFTGKDKDSTAFSELVMKIADVVLIFDETNESSTDAMVKKLDEVITGLKPYRDTREAAKKATTELNKLKAAI